MGERVAQRCAAGVLAVAASCGVGRAAGAVVVVLAVCWQLHKLHGRGGQQYTRRGQSSVGAEHTCDAAGLGGVWLAGLS